MKNSNIDESPSHEASQESIHKFMEYTWKDIHHSRMQNWTGLTVVATFHIGILKSTEYLINNHLFTSFNKVILFTFGSFFCLLGFLIARTHQNQLYKKLGWIKRAEQKLNLNSLKSEINDSKNENQSKLYKFFNRNFRTAGSLMSYFYLLLMILDIICIFFI